MNGQPGTVDKSRVHLSCALFALVLAWPSPSSAQPQGIGRAVSANEAITGSKTVRDPALRPLTSSAVITAPRILRPSFIPAETAAMRRIRLVRECEARNPTAFFVVTGVRLSAVGTDVDEIVGEINAGTTASGRHPTTSRYRGPYYYPSTLWSSAGKRVNLGKYPQTWFPILTAPVDKSHAGSRAKFLIIFQLIDVDGRIGGGDDEIFYIWPNRPGLNKMNASSITWTVPTCAEALQFTRSARLDVTGAAPGSASGNKVFFKYHVTLSRTLDGSAPVAP